ncbi:hypothetical protein J2T60_000488 [Natronospira proteinivora]|uniref:Uncharacterized protein n=1 Tax=Natronospira proteinivora TaxID=1807133 RepID=A0ABT1G5F2_9GAMM|nr:hypothetical protein [Natronospira proteinivora]MCP1726523.1 hypothetical protein [Natronospira proteinivora]
MKPSLPGLSVALVMALMLTACELGVSWSGSEKANAQLIFESLEDARRAADAANQLPADWDPDGDAVAPVIDALDDALIKASQVQNTVLTKAHPDLGSRFRLDYMRSLRGLRSYYQTGEIEGREDPRETLAEFTDWFYSNQHEFRWWRGYRSDVGLE